MIAPPLLLRKYEDLFLLAKTAIDEGGSFLVGQNANSLAKQITLFHFARTGYLLQAIYTLAIHGLATEAMVILRSLLNLFINIKWLTSANTVYRFERFADFEIVFKKLAMQTIVDHGDIWEEIKNDNLSVHDNDFEAIRKKYNLKRKKDFFNWSGKSIFKMASEPGVDLEKDYKIIYGRLSSIEHTGPESVRQYLDGSEKGITTIKVGPRDENIDLVLITAIEYYFHVKEITHSIFDIEWTNLEQTRRTFLKTRSRYWGTETDNKDGVKL
jgi:hypothetical protein